MGKLHFEKVIVEANNTINNTSIGIGIEGKRSAIEILCISKKLAS